MQQEWIDDQVLAAEEALETFARLSDGLRECAGDKVVDLLTGLLHYLHAKQPVDEEGRPITFEHVLSRAAFCFETDLQDAAIEHNEENV